MLERNARLVWVVMAGSMLLAGCGGSEARSRFAAGDRHFEKGEYEAAATEYRAGLELEPQNAGGWNRLGMACRLEFNTTGRSEWKDSELDAFRRAVEADSTYWPAFVNLGATLYYLGRREEAAPHLRRALELNPENPEAPALEMLLADSTDIP